MLYNKDWNRDKTLNPAKDILLRAADLLEKHGHIKDRLGNPSIGMCANGAIWYAVKEETESYLAGVNALSTHLGLHNFMLIPEWNNAPERTAEEVITAMKEAANAL